jgi:hypothetical protein
MMAARRIWVWSFVVGAGLTFLFMLLGAMRPWKPPIGFVPSDPDDNAWAIRRMPSVFSERWRELDVGTLTIENSFGSGWLLADERTMLLAPMAAGGGYLDPEEMVNCWRFRAGWPLRAVEMSRWTRDRIVVPVDSISTWNLGGLGGVPIGIRPLPFLGNLALMTAVCGILLTAVCEFRTNRRRRRGACEACGHQLAGGERCPECGAIVAPPVS